MGVPWIWTFEPLQNESEDGTRHTGTEKLDGARGLCNMAHTEIWFVSNWVTNSMDQNPLWEADSRSYNQEVLTLWKPRFGEVKMLTLVFWLDTSCGLIGTC
jgi:hypothetical protein